MTRIRKSLVERGGHKNRLRQNRNWREYIIEYRAVLLQKEARYSRRSVVKRLLLFFNQRNNSMTLIFLKLQYA